MNPQLAVYLAAVLSILIATLLGLLDDLFDIRWRHKLPIPLIASVPLLLVYYAEQGNTHVVMPKLLSSFFGRVVDLGERSCKQVCPTKLNGAPRSTLLCLHGFSLDIYHKFH
jgi:UDP-N-acetylmuramyl pentapeptide phosphotransferase/UDP-N-acetylglucosamine-1-phosphate transferase